MRFTAEGYLNNGGKFPAGISLICFFLAGFVKIAEGGYAITKQVHNNSLNALMLIPVKVAFIVNSLK